VCPLGAALQALLTSTSQLTAEALPTTQTVQTLVNARTLNFTQSFYVGLCWQNRGAGDTCTKPGVGTIPATMIPMLRVVVAVTWPSSRCPVNSDHVNRCSYVTDTLVNQDVIDPTFS
jgi:hypothetical protein